MSNFSRREFALAGLAGVGLVSCGNGIGGTGARQIDARVDETLNYLYDTHPDARDLAADSVGMLVMPVQTEAGFGFGGSYGRGALRVYEATVDYYSATGASAGLQIGAQQFSHVLFFMEQDALMDFRQSAGWTVGADAEYVLLDEAETFRADSLQLAPVIGLVFGQAGFRVGATIEGIKYTRIIP